jgi:hypothetical protein
VNHVPGLPASSYDNRVHDYLMQHQANSIPRAGDETEIYQNYVSHRMGPKIYMPIGERLAPFSGIQWGMARLGGDRVGRTPFSCKKVGKGETLFQMERKKILTV